MASTVITIECHVIDRRPRWCDTCFTTSILEADCALVDPTTLRVLHRFTVRADCPGCQ